ncbi:MAG: MarR family winged helix-turn-helix transcriptional regulator [Sphingorhabdus sp.]
MRELQQDEEGLIFRFFTEIGIIDQLATTALERMLPKSVTAAQFAILNHFVRLGLDSKSPFELAKTMQVTRATMSSTLKRMERNGLVQITKDLEDGRAKNVRLTESGYEMREACVKKTGELAAQMPQALGLGELVRLTDALQKVRIVLDQMR